MDFFNHPVQCTYVHVGNKRKTYHCTLTGIRGYYIKLLSSSHWYSYKSKKYPKAGGDNRDQLVKEDYDEICSHHSCLKAMAMTFSFIAFAVFLSNTSFFGGLN